MSVVLAVAAHATEGGPFDLLVLWWQGVWPVISSILLVISAVWATIKAWPLIRRLFAVVDIVGGLPEEMSTLKVNQAEILRLGVDRGERIESIAQTLEQHIKTADQAKSAIYEVLEVQEVIKHEVTHNGGSSIKDAVRRIEDGMGPIQQAYITGQLRLRPLNPKPKEEES